ncbi:hypothetical protein MYXO_02389 [Myxococcaceae bacterium]|jgi:hypothetical protein|nr:hypothetical protein MYXO_02389 [Myxococcaceae bacterium]
MSVGGEPEQEALRRDLDALASRASRTLSNRAQAPLHISLESSGPARLGALEAEFGPHDLAVGVSTQAGCETVVFLQRPLAYTMLALRFGGRGARAADPLPERGYSPLEERALSRAACELLDSFDSTGGPQRSRAARKTSLLDCDAIRSRRDEGVLLARFEVRGLATDSRFWIALPLEEVTTWGRPGSPPSATVRADRQLPLRRGVRICIDLGDVPGASLQVDGRVVARGRARFADARITLEIEEVAGDGDATH